MLIIFEGFEKSGKTTLSKLLSEKKNIPYFRSSKQIGTINLEKAIQYDWRFFLDYLSQTNSSVIIDRSFISQWVYSMILREQNVYKEYKNIGEYFDIFVNYCNSLDELNYLVVFCKRKNYDNEKDDHVDVEQSKNFNKMYDKFFSTFKINNFLQCDFEDGIEFNLNKIMEKI